jgi:hypothetical protein
LVFNGLGFVSRAMAPNWHREETITPRSQELAKMARPRNEDRENLPPNLYVNSVGYYSYRDPSTKQSKGLGKDRESAIVRAVEMNTERGIFKKGDLPKRFRQIKTYVPRADLLSEEEVRNLAQPIKQLCGVYLLLSNGIIVYVGQSANCHARIGTHFKEGGKVFDSYHIIECAEKELDDLETQYIGRFMPQYNVVIPKVLKQAA